MEIRPTPDQEEFIRLAIEDGRVSSSDEAIREAMVLWENRERRRLEILAALDEAEASLACGEGIIVTPDTMDQLVEDVKRRGRARLASRG